MGQARLSVGPQSTRALSPLVSWRQERSCREISCPLNCGIGDGNGAAVPLFAAAELQAAYAKKGKSYAESIPD